MATGANFSARLPSSETPDHIPYECANVCNPTKLTSLLPFLLKPASVKCAVGRKSFFLSKRSPLQTLGGLKLQASEYLVDSGIETFTLAFNKKSGSRQWL